MVSYVISFREVNQEFMHICEMYSFIDLVCKLHIYMHAVRCGATYCSTVK